ncbi:MAG: acyltransferase [Chitinophagaceae bacterium]|nr:acyltransferase [Chitinophagaceae bacterium]
MKNFAITNTNHRNLDGLRAIGILGVLATHFFWRFGNVLFCWVSIDLLFALSGLLITGILIETKEDKKYFQKFYMRRVLRIFPLYYLLVIGFTIYIYFITNRPQDFQDYKDHLVSFYTYTQNWSFIYNGVPVEGHLHHTWSLAVDEQIYLVWPLLIWLCKTKKQLTWLCAGILLFSFGFRVIYIAWSANHESLNPFPYFFHTLCRIDSFGAGALLYCLIKFHPQWLTKTRMILLSVSTFVLLLLFALLDNTTYFTGYFMSNFGITVAGIHFTTWLYFAIERNYAFLNVVWGSKILVYIGKISYSIYVYHLLLYNLLLPKLSESMNLFAATLVCLLITFAVSMLSYTYIEKPIIKLKRKFSYQ